MIRPDFGVKFIAFTQYFKSSHKALDIASKVTVNEKKEPNTYVYLPHESTITVNNYASDYGYYVRSIYKDGNDTWEFSSGHFKAKSKLEVGKTYPRGTIIAEMGTTGHSTGIHNHFVVKKNGVVVDPLTVCYCYDGEQVVGDLENAKVMHYTPISDIKGVERDLGKDQLKVLANALRVRDGASINAKQVGWAITNEIYNDLEVVEADGYKWHKIYENMWLAEVNIELLPKENINYEELYKEELVKNEKLELENKDIKAQLEVSNDKLNQVKVIVD